MRIRHFALAAGLILAAVSGLTRPNQLPAWLGTTSVALGGRRDLARRTKIVAALAFAGLLALPLLHNLRYGHEAVLLTTSGRIPDNLVLPGGVWMRFFTDPDARSRCLDQLLALAFVWKRHFARSVVSRAAIHACQLSWIACGVWMLRRRQRPGVADWALWASPLLFFAPHLFYVILDYTPRHLVVGYVAMASAVLLLTGRTFRGPAPGPPAGPAPSRLR